MCDKPHLGVAQSFIDQSRCTRLSLGLRIIHCPSFLVVEAFKLRRRPNEYCCFLMDDTDFRHNYDYVRRVFEIPKMERYPIKKIAPMLIEMDRQLFFTNAHVASRYHAGCRGE